MSAFVASALEIIAQIYGLKLSEPSRVCGVMGVASEIDILCIKAQSLSPNTKPSKSSSIAISTIYSLQAEGQ